MERIEVIMSKDLQNTQTVEEKKPTLEESFEALSQVIDRLEKEEISLEESFQLYHQGMELLKFCNDSIDKIEKDLLILEENGMDGSKGGSYGV